MYSYLRVASILAACGLTPASAADSFPFAVDTVSVDFADKDSVQAFDQHVSATGKGSLVYLDWRLFSPSKSELLGEGPIEAAAESGAGGDSDEDQDICSDLERKVARGGIVEFSGRPNIDNNHLLASFKVRIADDDPFTSVRCEHFETRFPVRLRGFFYVTDIGTATADQYEFRSAPVAADRVPAGFFKKAE